MSAGAPGLCNRLNPDFRLSYRYRIAYSPQQPMGRTASSLLKVPCGYCKTAPIRQPLSAMSLRRRWLMKLVCSSQEKPSCHMYSNVYRHRTLLRQNSCYRACCWRRTAMPMRACCWQRCITGNRTIRQPLNNCTRPGAMPFARRCWHVSPGVFALSLMHRPSSSGKTKIRMVYWTCFRT